MSTDQKQALEAATAAEATVILVELDATQVEALAYLEVTEKRDEIAGNAFAAVLRGKVQSAMDKAIKAKYIAQSKNKPAVAEECEKEIQKLIRLKQKLG